MLAVNLVIRQPVNLVIRQPVNLVIRHIKKTSLVQKLNTSKAWQRLMANTLGFQERRQHPGYHTLKSVAAKSRVIPNEYKLCMAQRTGTEWPGTSSQYERFVEYRTPGYFYQHCCTLPTERLSSPTWRSGYHSHSRSPGQSGFSRFSVFPSELRPRRRARRKRDQRQVNLSLAHHP